MWHCRLYNSDKVVPITRSFETVTNTYFKYTAKQSSAVFRSVCRSYASIRTKFRLAETDCTGTRTSRCQTGDFFLTELNLRFTSNNHSLHFTSVGVLWQLKVDGLLFSANTTHNSNTHKCLTSLLSAHIQAEPKMDHLKIKFNFRHDDVERHYIYRHVQLFYLEQKTGFECCQT